MRSHGERMNSSVLSAPQLLLDAVRVAVGLVDRKEVRVQICHVATQKLFRALRMIDKSLTEHEDASSVIIDTVGFSSMLPYKASR